MCKNHFGLKGTALFFFQTFTVRFCCRNGEYLGHQVDFRSSKIGAADDTNVSVPVPVGDSNGIYIILNNYIKYT